MIDRLHRLLDHLEWADRRALGAARRADDRRAIRLLAHLLASERVWLRRIESGGSSGLEIWPDLSPEECAELLDDNLRRFRGLLRPLSEEELDEEVGYRNSEGREYETPLGDILLHVFLHGTYHRGQIAMRVRDGGGEPVNTDFISFVRRRPDL